MKYNEIVKMIKNACDDNFYTGYKEVKKEVLECATKIYIEQMKQVKESEHERD